MFPKVVYQQYVAEVGKTITVMSQINSIGNGHISLPRSL